MQICVSALTASNINCLVMHTEEKIVDIVLEYEKSYENIR